MSGSNIKIYVEGRTDEAFIKNILGNQYKIVDIKGSSNIINKKDDILKEYQKEGVISYIIFDKDIENKKDGADQKTYKSRFNEWQKSKVIKDYFFIDNNLESFLLKFHRDDRILDCFNEFEQCLKGKDIIKSKLAEKSRLFAYIEAHNEGAPCAIDDKFDWDKFFDMDRVMQSDLVKFLQKI